MSERVKVAEEQIFLSSEDYLPKESSITLEVNAQDSKGKELWTGDLKKVHCIHQSQKENLTRSLGRFRW